MKKFFLLLIICFLFSCKEQSFQEKICSKYIGKTLVLPPLKEMINADIINGDERMNAEYKLIHILDITCSSCLIEVNDNKIFIDELRKRGVYFEMVGFSSYNLHEFDKILLQYPFYFDSYRFFRVKNNLKFIDITRTFLVRKNEIILVGNWVNKAFRDAVLKECK